MCIPDDFRPRLLASSQVDLVRASDLLRRSQVVQGVSLMCFLGYYMNCCRKFVEGQLVHKWRIFPQDYNIEMPL